MHHKFIILEGGDGTGKSTQVGRLSDYLESLGEKVVRTREPGVLLVLKRFANFF